MNLLTKIDFTKNKIDVIPISVLNEDNIIEKSSNLKRFNGNSLYDSIESIKRPADKPLRMPIYDIFKISGVETVLVGRVETGKIRLMQEVQSSEGIESQLNTMELNYERLQIAEAGNFI